MRRLITTLLLISVCACSTGTQIHYARATKLPEEVKGFMRLAQDSVEVNIVGMTATAEVNGVAGYILIHEQDLAQLVRNTQELMKLKKGE